HGGKNDLFPVRRNRSLCIVTRTLRQTGQFRAVEISTEDLIRRINGPDVAFAAIRRRWAGITRQMSGSINEPLSVGKKEAAGRPAFARASKSHVASIDVHAENRVPLERRPARLEDDFAT